MTPSKPLYRLIPLTQGQWAIVSPRDYKWLSQWKWYANYNSCTKSYYAGRNVPCKGGRKKQRAIWMHREILGLPRVFDGWFGDHKNHATTDNRRINLRRVTRFQNGQNHRVRVDSPSGFTGVSFYVPMGQWRARITFYRKQIFLGYFSTCEEAVAAYHEAAAILYGEYACCGQ